MKKLALSLSLGFLLILTGCEKSEHITVQTDDVFFLDSYISDHNPRIIPTNRIELRSREKGKFRNNVKNYFKDNKGERDELQLNLGYVMWDRLRYAEAGDIKLGWLPIAKKNSEYTEGLLIATIVDGEVVHVRADKRYEFDHLPVQPENPSEVDLEVILLNFLVFDEEIFDFDDCDLISALTELTEGSEMADDVTTRSCTFSLVESTNYAYQCVSYSGNTMCGWHEESTSFEWVAYCADGPTGGSGTGGDSDGGGDSSGDSSTHDIDDNPNDIIEVLEIGDGNRFKCLYEKFLAGNHSLFCNTIGAFYDSQDVILRFDEIQNSGTTYQTADGEMDKSNIDDGIITIYINQFHSSAIEMAGTILHEGIHASIAAFLNNLNVDVTLLNKGQIIEQYKQQTNVANADHYYMVDNYIIPMATALRQLDNYASPLEHYYSIAWQGLDKYADSAEERAHRDQYLHTYTSSVRNKSMLCGFQ